MKKSIKDLGATLNSLYDGEAQINIHLSDKPFVFHVVLKDRKGFDCKLSSFGANLWTRTLKGENSERYNSFKSMQMAINKLIKSRIETNGLITYSLSNEVLTF